MNRQNQILKPTVNDRTASDSEPFWESLQEYADLVVNILILSAIACIGLYLVRRFRRGEPNEGAATDNRYVSQRTEGGRFAQVTVNELSVLDSE